MARSRVPIPPGKSFYPVFRQTPSALEDWVRSQLRAGGPGVDYWESLSYDGMTLRF
jgi:hypothetical protein